MRYGVKDLCFEGKGRDERERERDLRHFGNGKVKGVLGRNITQEFDQPSTQEVLLHFSPFVSYAPR